MIERLTHEECVGCGACAQVCPASCIRMKEDTEGFLYPDVCKSRCTHCDLCEQACPVLSTEATPTELLPQATIAWTTNEEDLMAATSGGVFIALARQVLERGGSVVGAAYDEHFVVRHTCIQETNDLRGIARSKYVQSDTTSVFREMETLLREGKEVLFGGTACQVYALRAYCAARHLDTSHLLCIDIVCHGVPSPKLMREYLAWLESIGGEPITYVGMRERDERGRYGFTSRMRVDFAGRDRLPRGVSQHDLDSYFGLFAAGLAMRPSCHQCKFKVLNRQSLMSLGDCWFSTCVAKDHAKNGQAIPYEVTLCFIHDERGRALLQDCPDISTVDVDATSAILCNGGMLYSSSPAHPLREEFMDKVGHVSYGELVRTYLPVRLTTRVKWLRGWLKHLSYRIAPHLVERRAALRQRKEYERRMKRTISDAARSIVALRHPSK